MHKLLGGLCAALLFLAGLPQIGHTAEPVPLKTAWLGEHEAFAAWYAKQKGWDLEVIDLRTLIPLDKEAIFNSVKKTSKVLIVHEDKVFSGFGAEIAGIIGSELFQYLDAPIQRVGSLFTPVGFHPVLERAILPNEETIYHAAKELLLY